MTKVFMIISSKVLTITLFLSFHHHFLRIFYVFSWIYLFSLLISLKKYCIKKIYKRNLVLLLYFFFHFLMCVFFIYYFILFKINCSQKISHFLRKSCFFCVFIFLWAFSRPQVFFSCFHLLSQSFHNKSKQKRKNQNFSHDFKNTKKKKKNLKIHKNKNKNRNIKLLNISQSFHPNDNNNKK